MNTKHLSILLLTQSMKFEQMQQTLSEVGLENTGSPVLTSFDIIAELMGKPKARWVDWQWRDIYMFYMQEATKIRDNNKHPCLYALAERCYAELMDLKRRFEEGWLPS